MYENCYKDNSGSISIRRDVEILGELSTGQPSTKVKGGKWSFHSPLPSALPPTEPGPSIAIRGIHFDGASEAPIHIAYARRVVVSDNRITAVRPAPSPAPVLGREGLFLQQGISLGPALSFPGTYPAGSLTGDVRVERNYIDLASGEPNRTMGQAIIILWATGAKAYFVDNTAVNVSRNGIEALDNYPDRDGSGFVVIRGNDVTTSVDDWIKEKKNEGLNKVLLENSVLSTGKWIRFETKEEGIYKISRSTLASFGIDPNLVDKNNKNL